MAQFNLESYAPVQDRIAEFVKDFPQGLLQTFLRRVEGPEVVFEARAYRTQEDVSAGAYVSGWAREVEGKSPVNKTSHYENAETSAIGRALANMAYGTNVNRASRSEMLKVARMQAEHDAYLSFIKEHFGKLTEEHKAIVDGTEVVVKDFLTKNGKRLPEQYALARTAVTAIEQVLGVTFVAD